MLQYTKHGNSSHSQISAHYHTNKTVSNSQTRNFPKWRLQRWSHKDDKHYKDWLHFCPAISLSSYYRDQWSARKFNTEAIWADVTTSSLIDVYISDVSSSCYNLMRFLSPMQTCNVRQCMWRELGLGRTSRKKNIFISLLFRSD